MQTATEFRADVKLLIVEDDILPALALKEELADAGYEVLELTSRREEALLAARAGKPKLALVNIELHGRDDGIALARDLKALGIPVLFISGQVSRARSAQSVAAGSLPKPYRTTDVVRAVDYLLLYLAGEATPPIPERLEVFALPPGGVAPKAA